MDECVARGVARARGARRPPGEGDPRRRPRDRDRGDMSLKIEQFEHGRGPGDRQRRRLHHRAPVPDRRGRPRHVRLARRGRRGQALARDLRPADVPVVPAAPDDRPLVPRPRPARRLADGIQDPRRAQRIEGAAARPAQLAPRARPVRLELGRVRPRIRVPRLDAARSRGAPRRARGDRDREPGVPRGAAGRRLPARAHALDAALPAARRPRRARLPALREPEDDARQPHPPPRDPADDRRVHPVARPHEGVHGRPLARSVHRRRAGPLRRGRIPGRARPFVAAG